MSDSDQPIDKNSRAAKGSDEARQTMKNAMDSVYVAEWDASIPFADRSRFASKYNGTYVSPSDSIMSPASEKLAGFKQKQISKQLNNSKSSISRQLFTRNPSTGTTASEDPKFGSKTSAS
ncbi:hypothetical protein K470DRAFT_256434, partial [Piedraia hortae CBS 480.64]